MKLFLGCLAISVLLVTPAFNAQADERENRNLNVTFNDCTEFVGIAPVNEVKARALVPSRYQLVTDEFGAKLVVRISNCQGISVNNHAFLPGTVAHIGIMLYSPDGTATDPNTSINNYTLTYSSNIPELISGLLRQGVSATLDAELAYEFSPPTGPSELYAAISPDASNSPVWFLHGAVTNPEIPSEFLANWWSLSKKGEVKMVTTLPLIYFDFSSTVSFFTSRHNLIGELVGSNTVVNFPLSFRGQFSMGQMIVTNSH